MRDQQKYPSQTFQGFTLIEVLIALIILAIALFAIFKTTQDSIRDTIAVRDKLAAQWVALNVASTLQARILKPPSATTPLSGIASLLGRDWQWQAYLISSNKTSEEVGVIVRSAQDKQIWEKIIISVSRQL